MAFLFIKLAVWNDDRIVDRIHARYYDPVLAQHYPNINRTAQPLRSVF